MQFDNSMSRLLSLEYVTSSLERQNKIIVSFHIHEFILCMHSLHFGHLLQKCIVRCKQIHTFRSKTDLAQFPIELIWLLDSMPWISQESNSIGPSFPRQAKLFWQKKKKRTSSDRRLGIKLCGQFPASAMKTKGN